MLSRRNKVVKHAGDLEEIVVYQMPPPTKRKQLNVRQDIFLNVSLFILNFREYGKFTFPQQCISNMNVNYRGDKLFKNVFSPSCSAPFTHNAFDYGKFLFYKYSV